MDIWKKLFHRPKSPTTTISQNIQHDNPNRPVLTLCRHVGFSEPNIRKALVELNGIKVRALANGVGVTTLYGVIKGENTHAGARIILADALGLRVEELFHGEANQQSGSGAAA